MIEAAVKTCDLICALAGHETTGLRNMQLAERLGASPATITTYLKTLEAKGIVEQVPHAPKHWRLGPKLIQIALAHERHMTQTRQRLDEVEQRYSRQP